MMRDPSRASRTNRQDPCSSGPLYIRVIGAKGLGKTDRVGQREDESRGESHKLRCAESRMEGGLRIPRRECDKLGIKILDGERRPDGRGHDPRRASCSMI
jgi:hypothetical protein